MILAPRRFFVNNISHINSRINSQQYISDTRHNIIMVLVDETTSLLSNTHLIHIMTIEFIPKYKT